MHAELPLRLNSMVLTFSLDSYRTFSSFEHNLCMGSGRHYSDSTHFRTVFCIARIRLQELQEMFASSMTDIALAVYEIFTLNL